MGIKSDAKAFAILGIGKGGQISPALLDEYANMGMRRFYLESLTLRLPVYISEVVDQAEYDLPSPAISPLSPDCALISLSRITYSNPSTPSYQDIVSRVPISPASFSIKATDEHALAEWKLRLLQKPSQSRVSSLELIQAYSSTSDDYVPVWVLGDAREAVMAFVRYMLFSEPGKPWTAPEAASSEMGKFMAHVGRARIAADRDFIKKDLTASPRIKFTL